MDWINPGVGGVQFSWIALTWYVLQTTGSATKIGLIFAAYPIASMISSVMIGYLLDKYPRRALMVFDNMCQFALYLIIPILKHLNSLPFWTLVLLVVAAGCLSPLSQIGRGVILPNIVANEDLESANALSQIQMSFVTLFGPALGGVLVAMVGGAMTLVVTSICFLYYAMSLLWIPSERFSAKKSVSPTTERRAGDGRHSFIEGWMLLYRTPLLLLIVAVTLFFNLTYGPLEPAIPVMVSEIFHSGASVLGMIWSSFAVGALLGTFLWGRLRPKWSMRVVVSGVIFCWGICSCAMALCVHPWQVMLAIFFGGVTFAPYNIVSATWQQRLVPDEHRGKIYGVISSVTSSGLPLGYMTGGILIRWIGAPWTILSGGIATILLGLVVASMPTVWENSVRSSMCNHES